MKITIQSPHIKITKRLGRQIERKLEELTKIYERIVSCDIILQKEKTYDQSACHIEAKLLVPKGNLFAEDRAENFSAAFNGLTEKIESQLIKHKEKLNQI